MNGALELEGDDQAGWELVNGGDLELRDVGVVRRTDTGEFQAAWVGQLGGKSRIPLTFQPTGDLGAGVGRWNDSPTTARQGPAVEGEIRLGRLFELAVRKMALGPGDIRLVGWTEQDLSGAAFHPGSAQTTTRTFTLCHLRRGKLPAIGRDANVRTDFFAPKAETGTEEEAEVPPPAAQLKP